MRKSGRGVPDSAAIGTLRAAAWSLLQLETSDGAPQSMRRLPLPGFLLLRLAVRLLLALLLCLNGFLAPVAMAAHADVADTAAAAAEKAPPCHGDASAADAAPADHGDHGAAPSCCKPGHCVCACVFSLNLPFAVSGTLAGRSQSVPLPDAIAMQSARAAVPLRPPIG
jgi:hypothetical protein